MEENTHKNDCNVNNTPMHWRDVAINVGKILKNQKQLMALAMVPMSAWLTTILFMSIYFARPNGPCQEAKDLMDYGGEYISHALCCLPEWLIGAVGMSMSGALGLYAVPHIWRSRGATGGCCCYSGQCCKGCCGELCRTSSPFCAICIASMSIGLIFGTIISPHLSITAHIVAISFFFFGGTILMCGRVCRWVTCCCSGCKPNEEIVNLNPGSMQNKLIICMKAIDISSFMLLILTIVVGQFETTNFVASESLFCSVGLFAQYSVLTEMLINHVTI